MTNIEVMKMALDALEDVLKTGDTQVLDYTAPPAIAALRQAISEGKQREWVSLTDDEINRLWKLSGGLLNVFAKTYEAKLKEKNS